MKSVALVVSLISALALAGCIAAPVVPPTGVIYTGMSAPLTLGGGEIAQRRGTSSVTAILGLFSGGDGSVAAAARDGGISRVKRVDYEFTNVLGLYQKYTTIVYGD